MKKEKSAIVDVVEFSVRRWFYSIYGRSRQCQYFVTGWGKAAWAKTLTLPINSIDNIFDLKKRKTRG